MLHRLPISNFQSAISTVDSFLIAAVQTFMYDIYGVVIKRGLTAKIPSFSQEEKYKFINFSRFFVVVFGISSIMIAILQFGLIQFWTSMYSLMLAFFPPVFYAIGKKNPVSKVRGKVVLIGIVLAAFSALDLGIVGTFLTQNPYYSNIAPFAALIISTFFLVLAKTRNNDSLAGDLRSQ